MQGLDDYLINCSFEGVLGTFLQCIQQLISNPLAWEECECTPTDTRLTSQTWRPSGCQGTGRGRLETEEHA